MKKVICINDKNLPPGAKVIEGKEYTVIEEYANALDQRVYLLKEAPNSGVTKWGMRWQGYSTTRFKELERGNEFRVVMQEENLVLN